MIEMKPKPADDTIKGILKNTLFDENTFSFEATEGKNVIGAGAAKLYKDYAVLCEISFLEDYKDFSLEYAMGKSLLNFIDRRGIKNVYANKNFDEKLLKSLRFTKNDCKKEEEYDFYLDLTGYFDVNCQC